MWMKTNCWLYDKVTKLQIYLTCRFSYSLKNIKLGNLVNILNEIIFKVYKKMK